MNARSSAAPAARGARSSQGAVSPRRLLSSCGYLTCSCFSRPSEVLHLVEFYLEDGITDDEAVALIDLEAPRLNKGKNKWQEMMSDRILLIRIGLQSFSYGEKSNNFEFISPLLCLKFLLYD